MQSPQVFISYSHDSDEHRARVLALSNRLRDDGTEGMGGIDCQIDQYEVWPEHGWPHWCSSQLKKSQFVLVICTPTYLRRYEKTEVPGRGLGVTFEGHIITQELYNAQGENKKFIPIIFAEDDRKHIPLELQGATQILLPDHYEALYRLLTDQPLIEKPGLAPVKDLVRLKPLPPKVVDDDGKALILLLGQCAIAEDDYRPHYGRTLAGLSTGSQSPGKPGLTAMIRNLFEFPRDPLYGGFPELLVEFLERIRRTFPEKKTAPLVEWLKRVSPAGTHTLSERLDREAPELTLTLELVESAVHGNGLPVVIKSFLTDANYATTIRTWQPRECGNLAEIEDHARQVLADSQGLAHGQGLSVQVFAKHMLMGIPWHSFRVDPKREAPEEFGEFHSFILRSLDRASRDSLHNLPDWRNKVGFLRTRDCGKEIEFIPAPEWRQGADREMAQILAQINGMLWMRAPLGPFSEAAKGPFHVLRIAIKKGLPLVSWPIVHPDGDTHPPEKIHEGLRALVNQCDSVHETPKRLRNARSKCEEWARHTALFWDNDDSDIVFKKLRGSQL